MNGRMGTHAGDVVIGTDALGEQPVPNLPGEDGGTLSLVLCDLVDHVGGSHAGLRTPYGPRFYGPRLVVPVGGGRERESVSN